MKENERTPILRLQNKGSGFCDLHNVMLREAKHLVVSLPTPAWVSHNNMRTHSTVSNLKFLSSDEVDFTVPEEALELTMP